MLHSIASEKLHHVQAVQTVQVRDAVNVAAESTPQTQHRGETKLMVFDECQVQLQFDTMWKEFMHVLEGPEGGESLYSPHLAEGWLTKIPFTTDLVWLLTLRADGRCGTLGEMNPAAAST